MEEVGPQLMPHIQFKPQQGTSLLFRTLTVTSFHFPFYEVPSTFPSPAVSTSFAAPPPHSHLPSPPLPLTGSHPH